MDLLNRLCGKKVRVTWTYPYRGSTTYQYSGFLEKSPGGYAVRDEADSTPVDLHPGLKMRIEFALDDLTL